MSRRRTRGSNPKRIQPEAQEKKETRARSSVCARFDADAKAAARRARADWRAAAALLLDDFPKTFSKTRRDGGDGGGRKKRTARRALARRAVLAHLEKCRRERAQSEVAHGDHHGKAQRLEATRVVPHSRVTIVVERRLWFCWKRDATRDAAPGAGRSIKSDELKPRFAKRGARRRASPRTRRTRRTRWRTPKPPRRPAASPGSRRRSGGATISRRVLRGGARRRSP